MHFSHILDRLISVSQYIPYTLQPFYINKMVLSSNSYEYYNEFIFVIILNLMISSI